MSQGYPQHAGHLYMSEHGLALGPPVYTVNAQVPTSSHTPTAASNPPPYAPDGYTMHAMYHYPPEQPFVARPMPRSLPPPPPALTPQYHAMPATTTTTMYASVHNPQYAPPPYYASPKAANTSAADLGPRVAVSREEPRIHETRGMHAVTNQQHAFGPQPNHLAPFDAHASSPDSGVAAGAFEIFILVFVLPAHYVRACVRVGEERGVAASGASFFSRLCVHKMLLLVKPLFCAFSSSLSISAFVLCDVLRRGKAGI
jgi:hypothetical protein